jgi:hypothetical protein
MYSTVPGGSESVRKWGHVSGARKKEKVSFRVQNKTKKQE